MSNDDTLITIWDCLSGYEKGLIAGLAKIPIGAVGLMTIGHTVSLLTSYKYPDAVTVISSMPISPPSEYYFQPFVDDTLDHIQQIVQSRANEPK